MVGHVGDDLQLAVEHCTQLAEHPAGTRPSLFGLSFGSLPTLQVASRAPDAVAGVVEHCIFGRHISYFSKRLTSRAESDRFNTRLKSPRKVLGFVFMTDKYSPWVTSNFPIQ